MLTYVIDSNSNAALFSAQPSVSSSGTLTFTPVANAYGSATIGLHVEDNGGTDNNGIDTGVGRTLTINVTSVNDAPSFLKGANQTVSEGTGAQSITNWATNLSEGPANESAQTLTFHVSNDNTRCSAPSPPSPPRAPSRIRRPPTPAASPRSRST